MADHMIRLRRRHFHGSFIVIAPSWISNGFWAMRRDRVKNSALLSTPDVIQAWLSQEPKQKTDEDIAKFFAGDRRAFTVTRLRTWHFGNTSALLVADGDVAFVDPEFLDLFDVAVGDVLFAKDGRSALSNGRTEAESTFVLMPKRMDDEQQIKAQLQRWYTSSVAQVKSEVVNG